MTRGAYTGIVTRGKALARWSALAVVVVGIAVYLATRSAGPAGTPSGDPATAAPGTARPPPASLAAHPPVPVAAPAPPPPTTGGPSGGIALAVRVHDAAGSGIAGAQIVVWDAHETVRAVADSGGRARLPLAAEGEHRLRAAAEGFVAEDARTVSPTRGADMPIDVQLEPGLPFDGLVLDAEGDRPIAGATIRIEARGSFEGYSSMSSHLPYDRTKTDEYGRFHVRGIPRGQLATVVADAEGRRRGEVSVKADEGTVRPAEIVLRLDAGGTVKGVVRGPDGKPVGDATVYVIPADAEEIRRNPNVRTMSGNVTRQAETATTDDDGSYSISGLVLDREYVAIAEEDTLARSAETAGLVCSREKSILRVDLALRRPATLVVRLVDDRGSAVDKARVRIGHPMDDRSREAADPDGAYRFEGLPPGPLALHVRSPMFVPKDRDVDVAEGATLDVRIVLDSGARIEGEVVTGDGKPVAGAHVGFGRAAPGDDQPGLDYYGERSVQSDAAGRFVIGGLEPGDYRLGAQSLGFDVPVPIRATAPSTGVRVVGTRLGRAHVSISWPDGTPYSGEVYEWRESANGGGGGGGRKVVNGLFEVVGLDGKPTTLDLEFDDFAPLHFDVTTPPGEDRDLGRVRLDPGIALEGRIRDRDGRPVASAQVTESRSREATTDPDGRFALAHVARGPTTIRVSAEGFLPQSIAATPGAARLEVVLDRGALLKGVVKDAGGKRVQEDVYVWRIGADGRRLDENEEIISPEDDGSFSERLPAGRYRFVARAADENAVPPPLGDVLLVEGETKDVVLTLPAK